MSENPSLSPVQGPEIDDGTNPVIRIALGNTTSSIKYTAQVCICIPVSGDLRLTTYRAPKRRLSQMRKDVRFVCVGGCPLGEKADRTGDIRSANRHGTIMGEFARS